MRESEPASLSTEAYLLRAAKARIHPHVPADALDVALRRLLNLGHETPNLIENNRRQHQLLVDSIDIEQVFSRLRNREFKSSSLVGERRIGKLLAKMTTDG